MNRFNIRTLAFLNILGWVAALFNTVIPTSASLVYQAMLVVDLMFAAGWFVFAWNATSEQP